MLINLEPLAALAANNIVDSSIAQNAKANDAENIVTKSLGVLTEQGIYAFGLFLATRKREQDHSVATSIDNSLRKLLKDTKFLTDNLTNIPKSEIAEFYREITAENKSKNESSVDALRRILLIKQMFETTLTYARYAAKARKDN